MATLVLLAVMAWAPGPVRAESLCPDCEIAVGVGGTYHFWGATGGVVVPVTLTWGNGRYEAGIFRVPTEPLLPDQAYRTPRGMAQPYWGLSLSRRWRLFQKGPVAGFVGFGLAAKTESDELSSSCVDFASQLGLRFGLPGDRAVGELTMRHWSNGGIRLPNHGQDFVTLTIRLNFRDRRLP